MGCDIHAYAEIKRSYGNEEVAWYCCENFQLNPYYFYLKRKGESVKGYAQYSVNPLYTNRNYALFEALAGVRGSIENCLFDFKGAIPDDCSEYIKMVYEEGKVDYHSASYITLKELMEVDGTKTFKIKGYFTEKDAKLIDQGKGDRTCYGTDIEMPRSGFIYYREFEYTTDVLADFKKAYMESFKREKYLDYCTDERVLEEIKISGDDYRIVFWFDN